MIKAKYNTKVSYYSKQTIVHAKRQLDSKIRKKKQMETNKKKQKKIQKSHSLYDESI